MEGERTERVLVGILLLAGALTAFIFGFHLLEDEDFFWHLKTGELILKQGPPQTDLYSFRTEGKEWIDAQWLFQLIIYLVFRLFGFKGLSWFLALLVMVLWLMLCRLVFAWESYPLSFLMSLLVLWTISPRLNLRPELFSFLLTVSYLTILEGARRRASRLIFLLPLLQILWANLEGLWPLGLVIVGAYFLEEFLFYYLLRIKSFASFKPTRSPQPKRLFFILLTCLLASLFTPYHFRGFIFPLTLFLQVTSSANFMKKYIMEFFPLFLTARVPFIEVLLLLLIFVSGLVFFLNRKNPKPAQWLLWSLFLFLALSARRNIPFFCLYSLFVFASNIQEGFAPEFFSTRCKLWLRIFPISLGMVLSLFSIITVFNNKFGIWNKSYHKFGAGVNERAFPVKACDFLKSIGFKGHIFNQMGTGGYLIWAGYPDFKIYADSRLEVYGIEGMESHKFAFRDYLIFQTEELRYGFDAVLLDTREKVARRLIDHLTLDPGWVIVYSDPIFILFLKDSEAQRAVIEKYGKRKVKVDWGER